ncbi:24061_t:CDS:1, partial [Gigaspora rosea]
EKLKKNEAIYWVEFSGHILIANDPTDLPILREVMEAEASVQSN